MSKQLTPHCEHIQACFYQPTANSDYVFFQASFDADGLRMTGMAGPDKRCTWEQWVTFSRLVLIPFVQANGQDVKVRLVRSDLLA